MTSSFSSVFRNTRDPKEVVEFTLSYGMVEDSQKIVRQEGPGVLT